MIESDAIRWNVDRQNKDKEADISREIDGDAKGMKHTDSEANAKETIDLMLSSLKPRVRIPR